MSSVLNVTDLDMIGLSPWERLKVHPSILIFCCLMMGVGIPGNTIILYVYTKRIHLKIYGFFIKILAIFDLVNSIATIPTFLLSKIWPVVDSTLMCKWLTSLHYFNGASTGLMYIVIAYHRYKRICRPHARQLTIKDAKRITFICFAFPIATSSPMLFILTSNHFYSEIEVGNETKYFNVPFCDFTVEAKELKLSLAFTIWMAVSIISIVTSVVVLYSLIAFELKKRARIIRTTLNQNARRKKVDPVGVTKMFFALAVIYLITILPRVFTAAYLSKTKRLPILQVSQLQIFDFVIQLPYINCIVNPFVYGLSSKNFRDEVRSMCCTVNRKNTSSSSLTQDTNESTL